MDLHVALIFWAAYHDVNIQLIPDVCVTIFFRNTSYLQQQALIVNKA